MASDLWTVVKAVADIVRSMNLQWTDLQTPTVEERDVSQVMREDVLPLIVVSPGDADQVGGVYSAQRVAVTHPVQVTLVSASNQSQTEGRGRLQEWKEAVRLRFSKMQPFSVPYSAVPKLYRVRVLGAAALDRKAWLANYNVQFLFVLVELLDDVS